MPDYLRQRQYKRGGKMTRGAFYYQRRVPKELRHRKDIFKQPFIEVYLGTTDRTVAKRKVSAVNELWERTFDAMRKDETITSQQIERIRLAEQQRVFDTLMEDPYFAGGKLDEYIDSFFPNSIDDARKYLERTGLGQTEQNLNEAARAIWMGTLGAKVLFQQGLEPPAVPTYEPLMVDVMPDGPTLMEAAEAYEKAPDVNTTEKTRRQLKQSARLLGDHVGHQKPIVAITGRDAVAFLDRLANISPDYRRDPKSGKLTLSELEEFYPAKKGKGLSAATINRHAGHLRVLINWLIGRHELPEEHRNPFDGKSRGGKGGSYLPMSDQEISDLVGGAPISREFGRNFKTCVSWLILLAAYTGARAGELCALTVGDVREKDGISFIAIRTGKTENARRAIPLHLKLIEAGFLDYVSECEDRLFGVTEKTLATRFPDYRRGLGVDRSGVVFHSLRKSFVANLEEAEVPSDTAALLVGHKSRRSFTYDVYNPNGPTLRKLAEAVGKVRYDLSLVR